MTARTGEENCHGNACRVGRWIVGAFTFFVNILFCLGTCCFSKKRISKNYFTGS